MRIGFTRSIAMVPRISVVLVFLASPAWASDEWVEVEPIAGADAFVVTGDSTHVIAKLGGQWFVTSEPFALDGFVNNVLRAFDASLLAKKPAIALVVES